MQYRNLQQPELQLNVHHSIFNLLYAWRIYKVFLQLSTMHPVASKLARLLNMYSNQQQHTSCINSEAHFAVNSSSTSELVDIPTSKLPQPQQKSIISHTTKTMGC